MKLLADVSSADTTGAVAEVGPYENGSQDIAMLEPPMDILRFMSMVVDESG